MHDLISMAEGKLAKLEFAQPNIVEAEHKLLDNESCVALCLS